MQLSVGILSLVFSLPAFAVASWCQLAPSPDAPPVTIAPAPLPNESPAASFKQIVNLVDLFFTVSDKNGLLIPHLSQQNCSVLDDKAPQTLKSFAAETNQPLTLGILLDTSGSQEGLLSLEQDESGQFIGQVLRSKDEAILVSFDVNVNLLQDYTNNPGLLMHALSNAEINTGGGNGSRIPGLSRGPVPTQGEPRGTLFYDAIYLAANEKMNQEAGRKAIIVLTDGDDQGSRMTSQDAIAAAQKNNIPIYVVWVGNRCPIQRQTPPGPPVPRMLDDPEGTCNEAHFWATACPGYFVAKCISENTGGRFIDGGSNKKNLEAAFQQIEDELRSQYLASYTPSNAKADGSFHRIAVKCRGDNGQELKVQVRRGYYAPQGAK